MVELLILTLARCPSTASNTNKAILLLVVIATVRLSPNVIRSVMSTSAGVYGEGGIKKSALLVALPPVVSILIRPDVVAVGTFVSMVVAVAVPLAATVALNFRRLRLAVVSKFVPLIATGVPGVPIVGVKPVIVGAAESLTTNELAVTAEPVGVVTVIGPVVAVAGTLVTIFEKVAEVIEAATPLNETVF